MLRNKRVLIIIGGGIAAYKVLELIRRLRDEGARVRVVMTRAAHEFVTPVSVAAIAGEPPYTELFDAEGEHDVGHIRLARDTDLVVIAPATADLLGKLANGLADDLASAILLATDKPVLAAPAMNPSMWLHPATRRNVGGACARRRALRRAEQRRDGGGRRKRAGPHGRAAGNSCRDQGVRLAPAPSRFRASMCW